MQLKLEEGKQLGGWVMPAPLRSWVALPPLGSWHSWVLTCPWIMPVPLAAGIGVSASEGLLGFLKMAVAQPNVRFKVYVCVVAIAPCVQLWWRLRF